MHTKLLNDTALSGSSIDTALHQYNIFVTCLFYELQPTPANYQDYTPTHQTCTRSDTLESDSMIPQMTSASTISLRPPSPDSHLLSALTAYTRRHETHCRELYKYNCNIYLCPEDTYIREQRENNNQSTFRLGTTGISIYSGLACHAYNYKLNIK